MNMKLLMAKRTIYFVLLLNNKQFIYYNNKNYKS